MIWLSLLFLPDVLALDAPPSAAVSDAAGMDLSNLRDPFRRPQLLDPHAKPLSELEYFPTEQYRMVGVVTGPDRLRAMIVAPNGKTHFVAEKAKIGIRKGIVTRITANAIFVREKVLNTLGKEEIVNTELRLPGS